MIYKHDSEANEDEDMNLQRIPVYKKMRADNMVHINHNSSSCIIYKKSDCEKHLANLVCARAPATPIKSSERDHLSRNGHDDGSGMSIIYRNCSGKNLAGPEYIDLRK